MTADLELPMDLRRTIRDVADFPQPGVVFRDLTPVLAAPRLFARVADALARPFADARVSVVAAIESRGFLFGTPVAERLGAGVVPVRKAGKLPARTVRVSYTLEYGEAVIEMHADAVAPGDRVLIVDDVLATGGTAAAAAELVRACGGDVVGFAFPLAIRALEGRSRLGDTPLAILVDV